MQKSGSIVLTGGTDVQWNIQSWSVTALEWGDSPIKLSELESVLEVFPIKLLYVMPLLSHFHCPEPWKRRSVVYFQKINYIKCLHSINNFTVFLDTLRLLQHEVDKYALLFHSERGISFEKQRVLKHLDNYFLKQPSSLPKKKELSGWIFITLECQIKVWLWIGAMMQVKREQELVLWKINEISVDQCV